MTFIAKGLKALQLKVTSVLNFTLDEFIKIAMKKHSLRIWLELWRIKSSTVPKKWHQFQPMSGRACRDPQNRQTFKQFIKEPWVISLVTEPCAS